MHQSAFQQFISYCKNGHSLTGFGDRTLPTEEFPGGRCSKCFPGLATPISTRQKNQALKGLKDWLAGDSTSWLELNSFRKDLGLDLKEFGELLGVNVRTLHKYRKQGKVGHSKWRKVHKKEGGLRVSPSFGKIAPIAKKTSMKSSSYKRQNPLVGGDDPSKVAVPVLRVLVPSKRHLFIGLSGSSLSREESQERENVVREIREAHAPSVGEDKCECLYCAR